MILKLKYSDKITEHLGKIDGLEKNKRCKKLMQVI